MTRRSRQVGDGRTQQRVAPRIVAPQHQGDLQAAISHHRAGRLVEAERGYRALLAREPQNPELLLVLGTIARLTRRLDDAEKLLSQALQHNPRMDRAHNMLGVVFRDMHRAGDAERAFVRATSLNPKNASAFVNLGIVYRERNDLNAAEAAFRRVIALRPDDWEAHNHLGTVLMSAGREAEAEEMFRHAVRLNPRFANARFNLANLLRSAKRYFEAETSFSAAIELKPDFAEAHCNLGILYHDQYLLRKAEAALRRSLSISPESSTAQHGLARVLTDMGRLEEAAQIYQDRIRQGDLKVEWFRALSQFPPPILDLGMLLSEIDKVSIPNNGSAVEILESDRDLAKGALLDKAGQFAEAWACIERARRPKAVENAAIYSAEREVRETFLRDALNSDPITADSLSQDENLPTLLFIVGVSRSGKTTLERLIGSLRDVRHGYENNFLSAIPSKDDDIAIKDYRNLVNIYASAGNMLTVTAPRLIGRCIKIVRTVPNARIVFIKRNVDDLAVRIFMRNYTSGHQYAWRLEDIFDFITWAHEVMDIEAQKLPTVSRAVTYEQLVSDPRAVLNEVAELCGLDAPGEFETELFDDTGCSEPYRQHLEPYLTGARMS